MERGSALPRLVLLAAFLLTACNEDAVKPAHDAGSAVAGLSPEVASRVLAKVGDKVITVGDFASTLERMDQFDRLRYQTKERRRELLNEIIDVELLAAEAKRRGLDKRADTQEAIRQILRDAMIARIRKDMPAPADIPADEVRAYYQANIDKFNEPERRRVSAIVMDDKKEAEKVLKDALKIKNATEWGELFGKHSTTAPKTKGPSSPVDLAGDLGIVGPPEDTRGANSKVPEPVRAAVFKIGSPGAVFDQLVEVEGRQYIVRMSGITAAHKRTLEEADRSIRVLILQQRMQERDKQLDEELRKKFPVQIDEGALGSIKLPPALEKGGIDVSAGASAYPPKEADAGAPDKDGGN